MIGEVRNSEESLDLSQQGYAWGIIFEYEEDDSRKRLFVPYNALRAASEPEEGLLKLSFSDYMVEIRGEPLGRLLEGIASQRIRRISVLPRSMAVNSGSETVITSIKCRAL